MKLITQTLTFLSLITLGLFNLEAKKVEVLFDHTTQEHLSIPTTIDDSAHYCKTLKIENVGDQPLMQCVPNVNQPPCLSMDTLAARLAEQPQPLLALYQLWKNSVSINDKAEECDCHPLDLLNFKGACSKQTFAYQFIKLCNALGIKTRQANVRGEFKYDFCLDDDWNFIDVVNQQLYLGLNNEKLASSEEVMDDPFIALRTKHSQATEQMDVKAAWKEFSRFEILEPASAIPLCLPSEEMENRSQGWDLYPNETLEFAATSLPYQCKIQQSIQLEKRKISRKWSYDSAFPIQKIDNQSTVDLKLEDFDVVLKPGESFQFEKGLFRLKIAFQGKPQGQVVVHGLCAWTLFPKLSHGSNHICLAIKENRSILRFNYDVNEKLEGEVIPTLKVLNQNDSFDLCSPQFRLKETSGLEKIWWQISLDSQFQLVPSNFDQVEAYSSLVSLSPLSETFLNAGSTYYFRVKGYQNGKWGDWSSSYAFTVDKPLPVEEVQFDSLDNQTYELNWERFAEEDNAIEYLIFGSNSFDFIPSIYCQRQVNEIVNNEVVEEEAIDNLVAVTKKAKIEIKGGLAYYRIIARKNGQLSVPSEIIHIYDQELVQPRTVLQVVEDDSTEQINAKRSLFPSTYPWSSAALPLTSEVPQENTISKLKDVLRSVESLEHSRQHYESPDVKEEIWKEVRHYLLPENHPAWSKLNRVFCRSRATLSSTEFKNAGFKRYRPGKWSRVSASSHPEFPEYFIKAYCDVELGILYDWKKWIHRIEGAETIRDCIKEHHLQNDFKVPHKWIYPLPKYPSPPKSSRYLRKNFILVTENMRIQEHSKNEKLYKTMSKRKMNGLYIIFQVCGLYDSVYCFNCPYCKDGRIAIIDTEYHHKWPVPFAKLTKYFSSEARDYWEHITYKGGRIPDGESRPNPPRMDRRDHPPRQKPVKKIDK